MNGAGDLHLRALAVDGRLGVGIPSNHGGSGGGLADLFDAIAQTAATSTLAGCAYAVQRHFAEVLLASENIGLAQYRLPYILDGHITGACAATWPDGAAAPLTVREAGPGSMAQGALAPVPNVGHGWYLVTTLLQMSPQRPPGLVLLSSEQDGLHRSPAACSRAGDRADCAAVTARDVFLRGDEILQEDATQTASYLRRFAAFLQCAVAAGTARRVVEGIAGAQRVAARTTLARTEHGLLRVADRGTLPDLADLRIARSRLEHSRAQGTQA